jgi:acetoacetyl-CoA synthetase
MAVEMLTPIWERVLRRSPILPDDDFFDLGGDFGHALILVDEIEKCMGRQLPVTAIPAAPTVAAMARLCELPEPIFSPLVLIKAGNAGPPVFMMHGVGGSILEDFPIGRRIRWAGPIYGIQASGLDALAPPHTRIEDMAQFAMDAIVKRQPCGPYYLAGVSSGGIVMLEAAVRLTERGERVALLAFVDTYPHPKLWPLRCWIDDMVKRTKRQGRRLTELRPGEALSDVAGLFAKIARQVLYRAGGETWLQCSSDPSLPPALQQLQASYLSALARYRPRPFPGRISFLKAELHTAFPTDPAKVWGSLSQELEVDHICCDHVGLLSTNAGDAADWLSRCLDRA